MCAYYKPRPGDNPLPITKKGLLERWIQIKYRLSLTEVEYLTLHEDIEEDVIATVIKELHKGENSTTLNIDETASNINKVTDGCVK